MKPRHLRLVGRAPTRPPPFEIRIPPERMMNGDDPRGEPESLASKAWRARRAEQVASASKGRSAASRPRPVNSPNGGRDGGASFDEIGAELGVSGARAQQIAKEAKEKIARAAPHLAIAVVDPEDAEGSPLVQAQREGDGDSDTGADAVGQRESADFLDGDVEAVTWRVYRGYERGMRERFEVRSAVTTPRGPVYIAGIALQVARELHRFKKEHGRPPRDLELADALGIEGATDGSRRATVSAQLGALRDLGIVDGRELLDGVRLPEPREVPDEEESESRSRARSWTVADQAEADAWVDATWAALLEGKGLRAYLGLPVGEKLPEAELAAIDARYTEYMSPEQDGRRGDVATGTGFRWPEHGDRDVKPDNIVHRDIKPQNRAQKKEQHMARGDRLDKVWNAVQQHGPCATSAIVPILGLTQGNIRQALYTLVSQGRVTRKDGVFTAIDLETGAPVGPARPPSKPPLAKDSAPVATAREGDAHVSRPTPPYVAGYTSDPLLETMRAERDAAAAKVARLNAAIAAYQA